MTARFPHHYTSTVRRVGHHLATFEAPPRPALAGGPPPEFGGYPSEWSPEHLLVSAIGLCLFTTFEVFADKEKLAILGWRDDTTGVLDKTSAGLAFTSFTVDVELAVHPEDVERAATILERAHRNCIISNALRTPVTIRPTISAATAEQRLMVDE